MNELYSEKDIGHISGQLKKRWLLISAVLVVFLAVFAISMVLRAQWLTMLSVFLFGSFAVFAIDLFCLPLIRYRKLLVSALTGRTHTGVFEFEKQEPEDSMVDGVSCHGLLFLGEPDKHGIREQRFYWDAGLPVPDFRPGEEVTLKYTGKNIVGLKR